MPHAQNDTDLAATSWAERAADRSPSVQRSRIRSLARAKQIVEAARRLVEVKGANFTTQELVKEAGIAIQTFYKHFGSKDEVLLAVIEDMVTETCTALERRGRTLTDPVARLRLYVTGVIDMARPQGFASPGTRFVTTQHWRLQQQHPDELAAATRPVTVLLLSGLQDAADKGMLTPVNPEYDAWLAAQLITAVFHHYAFAPPEASIDEIGDRLWTFVFAAWGGHPESRLHVVPAADGAS